MQYNVILQWTVDTRRNDNKRVASETYHIDAENPSSALNFAMWEVLENHVSVHNQESNIFDWQKIEVNPN
jgi:hypothetical protein